MKKPTTIATHPIHGDGKFPKDAACVQNDEINLFHVYSHIGEDVFFGAMLEWKLAGRDEGQWAHFPGYKPEHWQTLFLHMMSHFQAWLQLQVYKAHYPQHPAQFGYDHSKAIELESLEALKERRFGPLPGSDLAKTPSPRRTSYKL